VQVQQHVLVVYFGLSVEMPQNPSNDLELHPIVALGVRLHYLEQLGLEVRELNVSNHNLS